MSVNHPTFEGQLFFMHIPKTVGTAFVAALDGQFSENETCPLHEGYLKFLEYNPEVRGKFKYIRGHFPYKLANDLPKIPRMITFLRNPVARAISAAKLHLAKKQQEGENLSLEEYLTHPVHGAALSNVVVKYLNDILGKPGMMNRQASLDLAKERLETMDVIGLAEQLETSLELLEKVLGFSNLTVPHVNFDPNQIVNESGVSQGALDRVSEFNRDEIDLYEFGKKLFQSRLAKLERQEK